MGYTKSVLTKYVPPFLLSPVVKEALAPHAPDDMEKDFPLPEWTFAKKRKDGTMMPQAIAHRGYKAKHAENTMGAFRGAVACGADGIETDIHVTRDGVVVLSHDPTLKRCFGKEEKIIDCDWEYISSLTTLKEPHERMPRLTDLLEYLAEPANEDVWLLLDIKLDVEPTVCMSLIAKDISRVEAHPQRRWDQRIILGFWASKYLPLCKRYLPTFPVTNICFSTFYARRFFRYKNVCYNMLGKVLLLWPIGSRFIRDAHARKRSVLVWTVNEDQMMRWSIKNGLDGVITDDPKRYLEICEEWDAGSMGAELAWSDTVTSIMLNFFALIFGFFIVRWRISQAAKHPPEKKVAPAPMAA